MQEVDHHLSVPKINCLSTKSSRVRPTNGPNILNELIQITIMLTIAIFFFLRLATFRRKNSANTNFQFQILSISDRYDGIVTHELKSFEIYYVYLRIPLYFYAGYERIYLKLN